jgi:hypothetical protein
MDVRMNRRRWLGTTAGSTAAVWAQPTRRPDPPSRKKIAAIVTEYRYNSHADVLCGRLLAGYSPNGIWEPHRNDLVALHREQTPATDMSRDLAARFGFRIYPTTEEALCLGGASLAVEGVVFIGEHGDYPSNDVGQKLYPRYELFTKILDVYEKSGRGVPTFFDKHFSYSWEKADAIYRRSRKLGFPFMAGSSIPFTIRKPALDPPLGTPIRAAIGIGYGDADAYGFHSLEALQCLVERRRGGETGITSVQWIEGDAIWAWRDSKEGNWSKPLLEKALQLQPGYTGQAIEAVSRQPILFVLNYRDGLKAAVLMISPSSGGWSVALRIEGQSELAATSMSTPAERPLPNWDALVRCIDLFLETGKPEAPVERTLLTTGALAFCFESKRTGKRVETPELKIAYQAPASSWFETA